VSFTKTLFTSRKIFLKFYFEILPANITFVSENVLSFKLRQLYISQPLFFWKGSQEQRPSEVSKHFEVISNLLAVLLTPHQDNLGNTMSEP